jgi:hypothetical protein
MAQMVILTRWFYINTLFPRCVPCAWIYLPPLPTEWKITCTTHDEASLKLLPTGEYDLYAHE